MPSHGQRVISGKRVIQAASDIFLGWTTVQGFDFYVRQFRDMKVIPDAELIAPYLEVRRPVRRRPRPVPTPAPATRWRSRLLGKGRRFDEAMGEFAARYADQTARDHQQLNGAVTSGAIESTDA